MYFEIRRIEKKSSLWQKLKKKILMPLTIFICNIKENNVLLIAKLEKDEDEVKEMKEVKKK